jgi:hypothetical protein
MATDISKVGNVVQVTEGAAQPVAYSGGGAKYSFNAAGTVLSVLFGTAGEYDIEFEDLTIGGVEPADTDAAYTALSTVFPSEGGGSGTTPTLEEVLAEGDNANNQTIQGVSNLFANGVIISGGGIIQMVDTVTSTIYNITVANGALVLTEND